MAIRALGLGGGPSVGWPATAILGERLPFRASDNSLPCAELTREIRSSSIQFAHLAARAVPSFGRRKRSDDITMGRRRYQLYLLMQ